MKLEKKLLKGLKRNNKKAQLFFYNECFSVMMSVALRYKRNKDDAAVLVNESFLKILTNIDKYNPENPLEAWIRRIVINCAIDDFRKNAKGREVFKEYLPENDNTLTDASYNKSIDAFEAEEIDEILKQLPKATGVVFNLYTLDGFSHKEVSEKLGITVETSKWHVKVARKKLRAIIGLTTILGVILISLIDML